MHDAIAFLETMGQDASLRHADANTLQTVMNARGLSPFEQAALARADGRSLPLALGAKHVVACLLFPVKEDEDDKPDEPQRDDDEIRMALAEIGAL
ncbi:MAG: hypothetical protein JSS45_11770 [Proteobacteria bacterium]|nr:hypothetical protein [Pseudomonadota bacterium]